MHQGILHEILEELEQFRLHGSGEHSAIELGRHLKQVLVL
jgi:hypothetical protein